MTRKLSPVSFVPLLVLLANAPAFAGFITFAQPTPAYTADTTLIPIAAPDYQFLTSISDGSLTVSFNQTMQARTVPGSWGSWGAPPNTESSTPRVLDDFYQLPTVTFTLSQPEQIFGFEAEPTLIGLHNISASFYDGGTLVGQISRNLQGYAGALLFAASTDEAFTSVVVTANAGADGFAIAELRFAPPPAVPEPASVVFVLAGAALLAARPFKRRARLLRSLRDQQSLHS